MPSDLPLSARAGPRRAAGLLLLAAAGIPLSLLWDFSWEGTVGIDRVWAAPHTANYLAIALAGLAGLLGISRAGEGIRLGKWSAPLGSWVALWGALAFVTAFLFDRWWQAGYGLAAGIWHPPQLLKAVAFFAVVCGAWFAAAGALEQRGGGWSFSAAGGVVLAMIGVVVLAGSFANLQHSAPFYEVACATYPLVLGALAVAGQARWSATLGALTYMALWGAMVWVLPLIPGAPLVAPIYNPRDHLLPPPFPLLLIAPALAIDALLRVFPGRAPRSAGIGAAVETGLAFVVVFVAGQWVFAQFLLSPAADNWFFAGGGRHWPFFLQITPEARATFWRTAGDGLTPLRLVFATVLAIVAAGLGLTLGTWMKALRR